MKSMVLTGIAVLFLFSDCARNPVTGKREVVLMSEAQELAMGKEADPQIVAQFGLYEDQALQDFITQKGKAMAAVSHRPNLDYQFRIVNSDVLNAFALPGGYVYFTRGIMAHFNNEAEFAGVLGHEIGHVAARHSVAQQRNALLGQLGIIAGVIVAPNLAQFAESASQGLGLLLLKFGRDDERESDRLGVEYSTKIGYDAHQMAHFFNTLKRQSAQSGSEELPPFLSTHPDPGERNQTVDQLATEWQQKAQLAAPKVARDAYLKRIEGLVYGEDPREGFVEAGVFYHPTLKFQFPTPSGWALQNTPQRVQMAPADGKALLYLTLAQGKSLQEAATALLQQNSLQAVESRETTVNGLPALVLVADQQAQQQQQQQQQPALRTLSYLIQYGGVIYHLLGVSTLADFPAYQPQFTSTMQNFRQLTDAAKINRKPERIRIKTVSASATLEQVLRQYGISDKRLEEHAILNGMALTDRLAQGTLIKVVGQ
ncbi:M48 family metalloprotease [Paraflavisolibacter sp. H34]|uniref:M48 family metalloprotease n=1 Tax=Huijunlia imazamoxiresistens TaxID=3127457 RepID=UPI003019320F